MIEGAAARARPTPTGPHSDPADRFGEVRTRLTAALRVRADELVFAAYLDVFAPCLREIGQRGQLSRLSVAHVEQVRESIVAVRAAVEVATDLVRAT